MTIEEQNIEFSKLKDEITKNATLKDCILKEYFTDCSAEIINAHSLQRMGALSRIEGEINGNNKVYALTEKQINPQTGQLELRPIGKKAASTFFGFCGNHDSRIFQSIEQNPNNINLDLDEHCFLLSFRAFAISFHRKKEDINLLSKEDEDVKNKIRKYYNNFDIESQLEISKVGLEDLDRYKTTLITALKNKDYSCLDYLTYELDYTVPIAMSMMTTPPYLFSGKSINISPDPNYQYSDILTTVIPLESRSLIILAAFPDDPFGSDYLTELENMADLKFQKALTWHILTNSENCFFSPKWFDKLDIKQKQYIIKLNDFSGAVTTPYLKYDSKNFNVNFFDNKNSIL